MKTLAINPEFQRIIPPLTAEEKRLLEDGIKRDGCLSPLITWHGFLVDGHHRYEICQRLHIRFHTTELNAESREEVILWICMHQLGRRNLSEENRRYLIGKRYEMEKIVGAHNPDGANQHSHEPEVGYKMCTQPLGGQSNHRTRERIGEEYGVSGTTVTRYARYSRAVDRISEVAPRLGENILHGSVKVTYDDIQELAGGDDYGIEQFHEELVAMHGDRSKYRESRLLRMANKLTGQSKSEHAPVQTIQINERSVKDMPGDDLDQLASTLAMTIPSWISMTNRTYDQLDIRTCSKEAAFSLWCALTELIESLEKLRQAVEDAR